MPIPCFVRSTVDGVQDFLLIETVMIGEALGVHQLGALFHEALLKTLRLRNAAERGHLAALEPADVLALFGVEHILKIQGPVNALDNAGLGVVFSDAGPQAVAVAVALGNENGVGPCKVRYRFTQGAARE